MGEGSLQVVDLNTGRVVVEKLRLADTFWGRFTGLWGSRGLTPGEGLLMKDCASVHTFFMRFPIDVIYLDKEMWVLAVHKGVRPWRVVAPAAHGAHTLETGAGVLARLGVRVGHRLQCRPGRD